jgi:magnesium-transporting ATPase (P-type)
MAAEVDSPVSPSEYEKLTGKQEKLQDTVFGKAKRWSVLDRKEWAFLIISTVSILGVAAMTIFRVIGAARGDITNDSGLCESNEERLRDLFFAIILLLNLSMFCGVYINSFCEVDPQLNECALSVSGLFQLKHYCMILHKMLIIQHLVALENLDKKLIDFKMCNEQSADLGCPKLFWKLIIYKS